MPKVRSLFKNHLLSAYLCLLTPFQVAGQSPAALSQYFEGKQVAVKLDMPATQKGVDIYPQRPQPLDTRSYSDRLKKFGVALRNGDTVMVTKLKVKSDSVEFQLGGGGFGTATDQTDDSVHFTPADKSSHEKELEDQLKSETDEDRRRSISRELDDLRRDRERQDRRNQAQAQDNADERRQQIAVNRTQGGSRFNIHFDKSTSGNTLTPQLITEALTQYVSFSPGEGGSANGGPATSVRSDPAGPPPPQAPPADPVAGLKKGLTRAQVEALLGPASEAHDRKQDGLAITTCNYQSATNKIEADFVNGVLVQYTVSSR